MDVRGRVDTADEWSLNLLGAEGVTWSHDTDPPTGANSSWQIEIDGHRALVHTSYSGAAGARLRVAAAQSMVVGEFPDGVVQLTSDRAEHRMVEGPGVVYTVDGTRGSLAVVPRSQIARTRVETIPASQGVVVEIQPIPAESGTTVMFELYANALAYPTHELGSVAFSDRRDTDTHMIALYGSQVGCLGSLDIPGSAYPTLAVPERAYGTLHTFFDPDAWSLVASLSFSGVDYLQREARRVLELSLSGIADDGLIPHHFDGEIPLFRAISGAPQPGPNVFWIMAAIDHYCATGDRAWLEQAWMRGIRPALEWLLARFDSERRLMCVDGPLWVDVFRREGFTFDTNVMMVRLLDRCAQAASFLGHRADAERFRHVRSELLSGLESLWAGDHYVTSIGPDSGAVVDNIDSENYLAVAFGVADATRSARILAALDAGSLTHPGGKGTWVSQVRYDEAQCYEGNTGDSDIAMARLWWADLTARHSIDDRATFTALFEAVRADLLGSTWMRERYDSAGRMTRAKGYHEYPGILDMAQRECLYGLGLDLEQVTLKPMKTGPFDFRLGSIEVRFSQERIAISVPGEGVRRYEIHGLVAGAAYQLEGGGRHVASASGQLSMAAPVGEPAVLSLIG